MSTVDAERITATDSEGWVYDAETGEVLGRADVTDQFVIDTPDKADWVLERRSEIEGRIAGIDARLRAVTEQLRTMRREQERRLSWWEWRFSGLLVTFARSCLTGKSRTARFGWGSVVFRTTPGNNQIIDMAGAVEWVKVWNPAAVRRVESVTVKDVLATAEIARQAAGEDEPMPFLVSSGPGESVHIQTGVEVR